jgi:hypothetical protein
MEHSFQSKATGHDGCDNHDMRRHPLATVRAAAAAATGSILLVVLALPTAFADEQGTGVFHGATGVAFSPGTQFALTPLALYVNRTDQVTGFELRAPTLHVIEFKQTTVSVAHLNPVLQKSSAAYDVHDAVVTLPGSRPGWFGAYLEGAPTARGTGAALVVAQEASSFGNDPTDPGTSVNPNIPTYERVVPTTHLEVAGMDQLAIDGPLSLKLRGPTLHIAARENTTTIETGTQPSATGAPDTTDETWVTLEADQATLSLRTTAPYELPVAALAAMNASRVDLRDAQGTFATTSAVFENDSASDVWLAGMLRADLTAVTSVQGSRVDSVVQGALTQTSLRSTLHVVKPLGVAWIAAGALVGAVGLTLVGAYQWRKRGREVPLDQCVELADVAASQGRYHDALDWTRKALAHAPDHPRLLLNEAFFLQETGDFAGALDAFERASARTKDGEADFLAAALLETVIGDRPAAVARIARALERTPTLVFELEVDPRFRGLQDVPEVQAAMRAAEARL